MLTKADDYPIHQTPEPIAYSGGHRNFYDRYFFNGYSRDGELFFALALGVYPHLNIMDASFSAIHDGIQYNLHASRILPMERLDTEVGPIGIEILEPLKSLRIFCKDDSSGPSGNTGHLKADLRFNHRCSPIEEPRFTHRIGSRLMMDVTRMTQNGNYQGKIVIKGKPFQIEPENFWGTRDRSWGIRPVGARDQQPNPFAPDPQFYWLWAPLNFPGCSTFYHVNSDDAGQPWNTNALLVGDDAESTSSMQSCGSKVIFQSGSRHARTARIDMTARDGNFHEIQLEPLYNYYMKGLGYGHPEWGHGLYHGELETGYDEFKLGEQNPEDPTNFHIQALCKAELKSSNGTKQGIGVLEQLIIGKHVPSGFSGVLDMAP